MASSRVNLLIRLAEWSFFVGILELLIPNETVKGVVVLLAAVPLLVAGLLLLLDVRGVTAALRADLEQRRYSVMGVIRHWPTYFWRAMGLAVVIVGLGLLGSGVALLV
jgi:hypothetical protein